MDDNKSLVELIDSINNSIEDIQKHPAKIDKLPSNLEIMVKGVTNSKAIDFLFSNNIDNILNILFKAIENGNIEEIFNNEDKIKKLTDNIFGNGSFEGPISRTVLNSIQSSLQSKKYNEMKSNLGKVVTVLKKKNLIIKNLKNAGKNFKNNKELMKKYNDTIYAIKRVLKLAEKVYLARKQINDNVFKGLNNIVHEEIKTK